MRISDYEKAARETDLTREMSPEGLAIAVLGLVSETSAIANVTKKYLRDGITWEAQRDLLQIELGDVLWYLSNVAFRLGISLERVACENLERTRDRHGVRGNPNAHDALDRFDAEYPDTQRFPDRMVFCFRETFEGGKPRIHLIMSDSDPNPFPDGALAESPTGKKGGFSLGDSLTDNAHQEDKYRYHDAIHIGLMTVLGWSPVMRALLRLKRKRSPDIDENEDGQRACDVEEGIVSWLSQRACRFGEFVEPRYVDNQTLDHILEHASGLEVRRRPTWMWKDALAEGFKAWKAVSANAGGYLVADLNARSVTYSKLSPVLGSVPNADTVSERSAKQP